MPATGRTIVFLSEFGYRNEWVGICHAVMNRVAPTSPVVDLSHGIPPLDVRGGAVLLVDSRLPRPRWVAWRVPWRSPRRRSW
jgi:S-adenosylmethionine hydrolase